MTLFPRNVFEESLTVEWAWASYADRGRKTKTKSAERHVKTSPRHETVKMARIFNFMSIDLSCFHLIWKEAERDVKSSNCSIFLRKQCLLGTEGQTWNKLFKAISKLAGGSGFLLSIGHWRLALGKWLAGNSTWLQFEFFTELLCTFASSFFCLTELGQNERQFVFLLFWKYSLS